MKRTITLRLFAITSFAGASLFLASCNKDTATDESSSDDAAENAEPVEKDTLGSLTDELIVQLNQYADIVLAVKDTTTAQEAVSNLDQVGDAIGAIAARLDKIETPDEATNIAVDEKMKNASMAIQQKMQAAGQIMSNQEVAKILIPALQNFGVRMAEHEKVFRRFGSQENEPAQQQPNSAPAATEAPAAEAPATTEVPATEEAPAAPDTEAVPAAPAAPAAE